jgi:hypothetical protein
MFDEADPPPRSVCRDSAGSSEEKGSAAARGIARMSIWIASGTNLMIM